MGPAKVSGAAAGTIQQIGHRLFAVELLLSCRQAAAAFPVDICSFLFRQCGRNTADNIRQLCQILGTRIHIVLQIQIKHAVQRIHQQPHAAQRIGRIQPLPSVAFNGHQHIPHKRNNGKLLLQGIKGSNKHHIRLRCFLFNASVLYYNKKAVQKTVSLFLGVYGHLFDLAGLVIIHIRGKSGSKRIRRRGRRRGSGSIRLFHRLHQIFMQAIELFKADHTAHA